MGILKYFSKQNILVILLVLAIVFVFCQLAGQWAFPDTNWEVRKDSRESLAAGQSFIQKFEASRNNLKQIEIRFADSKIGEGGEIKLQVYDENCSDLIREKSRKVASLGSDETYNFPFEKISNSQGKIFCLKLTFEPKEQKRKANVYLVKNESPENKYLFDTQKNQELPGQSLSMRPGYQADNWRGNIQKLNQRISQYKPWFFKHYFLYFIALGFILLSTAVVFILILM